jgi:hypothetical protein
MGTEPRALIPPVTNWTPRQMHEVAARAVGRVVRDDVRGITNLSIDEIAAMTGTLIGLGLIAILPGEPAPEHLIYTPRKEAPDGQ